MTPLSLNPLSVCCDFLSNRLFDSYSVDRQGRTTWNATNNCMRIGFTFGVLEIGGGTFFITHGILSDNLYLMSLGALLILTGGCLNAALGKMGIDRYFEFIHVERIRDIEEGTVKSLSKRIEDEVEILFDSLCFVSDKHTQPLPSELWYQIFNFLSLKDLLRATSTCKSWYILGSSPILWSKFLRAKSLNSEKGKKEYIINLNKKQLTSSQKKYVVLNEKMKSKN